ncbi:MAG: DUF4743 domain-containing protein [Alphaproteobacteria bacterium]|nr:DUF4743 domain-containing protein [Alphaproteobacteria bacterium]
MQSSGYLRHFTSCRQHDLNHFVPFFVGSKRYGWIKRENVSVLASKTKLFEACSAGLKLSPKFTAFEDRSGALMEATFALCEHIGKPLRNEMYPIVEHLDEQPLGQIDRVAVPWFGVRAWGIHVNGYVHKADGLWLWVGKRADNRQVEPGKLDNIVGGGLPIGISLEQNLCKEAKEEAGMEASLALTAKLVGPLSYSLELADGLRDDTLYIYDLELPESFTPRNTDGEVAEFRLMPVADVARLVRETDAFKFNCGMIVTNFLLRHGFIAKNDSEYAGLVRASEQAS